MCVVVFVVVRGRAHWRAAYSAAGCQGLNRAASEVRFRGETPQFDRVQNIRSAKTITICKSEDLTAAKFHFKCQLRSKFD